MTKASTGGRRGVKALPTERKRLNGNPGKRALGVAPTPSTALEIVNDTPQPPEHLDDVGRRVWISVWSAGRRHLADVADGLLITRLCERWSEGEQLRKWLADDPLNRRWYTTSNGQTVTHPAVKQLEQIDAQLTSWLSSLGFTPSDRARLGLAEVRVADALDEYRRKAVAATVVNGTAQ